MSGTVHEVSDQSILETLCEEAAAVAQELCEKAALKKGQLVVVGCSTSETLGEQIGTWSVPDAGKAIYRGLARVFDPRGSNIAAQCCEHLNRALIVPQEAAVGRDIVNVVPQPKAGGSFATAAYQAMKDPVALEWVRADAGIDIGGTLIGMHLKPVAVPLRFAQDHVGHARVSGARVRPKYIGGCRAQYDPDLG